MDAEDEAITGRRCRPFVGDGNSSAGDVIKHRIAEEAWLWLA